MDKTPEIDVFGDLPESSSAAQDKTTRDDPREWARFLAKTIDFSLAQILTFAAVFLLSFGYGIIFVGLMGWPYDESLLTGPVFVVVYLFLHAILFVFAEAFCISVFGGTPGKTLMGIRVASVTGRRLGFGSSLKRSFSSVTAGLGFGIPILNLITMIYQYNKLTSDGAVFWDKTDSLQYLTHPVAAWRWAIAIGAFVLIRGIEVAGQVL